MGNKKFLNVCYKFFNRFIISNELIEGLSTIDRNLFSTQERKDFEKLLDEIKNISETIPNEVDDFVNNRKKGIEKEIKKLENFIKGVKDKNFENVLRKKIDILKEDYAKEIDSYDRWVAIMNCITNNDLFNKCFDSLSDYELLEFIAQNIKAPLPPQIDQEKFEDLVKVGIEKDEREWLWRLAFNYEKRNINFNSIIYYFIKVKDGYYLSELISAVGYYLDIDYIVDKINDNDLIKDLEKRKNVIEPYFTKDQFEKLISKIKEK